MQYLSYPLYAPGSILLAHIGQRIKRLVAVRRVDESRTRAASRGEFRVSLSNIKHMLSGE